MFDIAPQEILLVIIVAVIVIGPKDLPLALRTAGRWIGKVRKVSGQFRAGLDAMVREAEMEEMEKKWREQNDKIMREHPAGGPAEMEPTGAYPASLNAPPSVSAEAKAPPVVQGEAPGGTSGETPAEAPAETDPALDSPAKSS